MPVVKPPDPTILFYCYGQDDYAIEEAKKYCHAEGHTFDKVRIGKMLDGIVVVVR